MLNRQTLYRCNRCEEHKSASAFYERRTSKHLGWRPVHYRCKLCLKACSKKYNTETKEARRAHSKKYYQENKQRIKASEAKRYVKDPTRKKAYAKTRYQGNPEKHQAYVKQWAKDNPERTKELTSRARYKRRARLSGRESHKSITIGMLYEVAGGICGICILHCTRMDASIDHVMPVSKGGSHTWDNVQLAHLVCNRRKSAKLC